MRVTQRIMVNNYLNNLSKNYKTLGKLQEQLSTGHKVSRPSDNPFVVTRTMELKASIAANERYKQNIEEAIGWTDTQEVALGQINDVLQKVRELTVQGATGTNSEASKNAISSQIKQLKEQMVEIVNTSYDGRYVFSGQKTTEKPFTINAPNGDVTYNGSDVGLKKELAPGVIMDIGINGGNFFKENYNDADVTGKVDPTGKGIFSTIDKIIKSLENNGDTSSLLGDLDKNMENITTIRTECGAMQNRLSDMHDKNDSETFNMTGLLAKTYDIDLPETYMQAKVMESVYQASLNVGARILQPSILDYLR